MEVSYGDVSLIERERKRLKENRDQLCVSVSQKCLSYRDVLKRCPSYRE